MLDQATWQANGPEPVAEAVGEPAPRVADAVSDAAVSAASSPTTKAAEARARSSRSEPLDQYIAARQGPIEVGREVEIIGQLAHALARMHQSGLLHLDVRPSTIRIDAWGGAAEFANEGHAASVDAGGSRPDRIPGFCDLPYVSAEVLAREPAQESDDVYAFACVAYELLTGLHPYARRSALDALDGSFQPAVVQGLSDKQNAMLLRALEPRRIARRVTMAELASAFGGDAGLSKAPLRRLARRVGPHAHAAITATVAFMLGVAVHSMWTHFTAPTTVAANLPPTPWWGATLLLNNTATMEVPAPVSQARDPVVADAPVVIDSKRITLAHTVNASRAERELSADKLAQARTEKAPTEKGQAKAAERNAERTPESNSRAAESDASRGTGESSAARAAALQQAQASAAEACPSCSCPDLGMKRFVAGVSLNWEEANYYLNVCGQRG